MFRYNATERQVLVDPTTIHLLPFLEMDVRIGGPLPSWMSYLLGLTSVNTVL